MEKETDQSFFEAEAKELGELVDEMDKLVEHTPYTPNRATRRAQAKRDRALQKRNPRA